MQKMYQTWDCEEDATPQPGKQPRNTYSSKQMDAIPQQPQVPGMTYVPAQAWDQPYPLADGFLYGTIFPCLHKPFDPEGRMPE